MPSPFSKAAITFFFLSALLLDISCQSVDKSLQKKLRKNNETASYIIRKSEEYFFQHPKTYPQVMPPYPWESKFDGKFPKITQAHFTCKGSYENPIILKIEGKESGKLEDCGGHNSHSLPLKNGREFIYPILIDLLNYLQDELKNPIQITCGHRCPTHNQYADPRPFNLASKHQVGAEVDFYVKGMEHKTLKVIEAIKSYYLKHKRYQNQKDYTHFQRYHKDNTDVSTPPWYNKEIFIKLYNIKEGRDKDNEHPYPYISIQVRYDTEENTPVHFKWDEAQKNYLRK